MSTSLTGARRDLLERRFRRRYVAAVVFSMLVVTGGALALRLAQENTRSELAERFSARATLAARFVATYVEQLLTRERALSERNLAVAPGLTERFEAQAAAFGFSAAVLLDGEGRLLAMVPHDPVVLGRALAPRYEHLAAAVRGEPSVSDVVPSAATGAPVVAFATPFHTPRGRLVFSGAYVVAETPLGAFLDDAVPIPGVRLYLVDRHWAIVARSGAQPPGLRSLAQDDPSLAAAVRADEEASYTGRQGRTYAVREAVPGTNLSLVVSVPAARLFAPVDGVGSKVPWVLLGVLAALALAASWLAMRYVEGRHRLAALNVHLDEMSRLDELTALPNRRHLIEHLDASLSAARRHQTCLSVLVIDVDHFKRVNDTFGHPGGDCVLRHVAAVLRENVRAEDTLGRWGGEEFLAVLPRTDLDSAELVAKRLGHAMRAAHVPVGAGGDEIAVTVSIGCSATHEESSESLLARADAALYRAKAAGRDRVECIAAKPSP